MVELILLIQAFALIVLTFLVVMGIDRATSDGYIGFWIYQVLDDWRQAAIEKQIEAITSERKARLWQIRAGLRKGITAIVCGCPYCMTTFWTPVVFGLSKLAGMNSLSLPAILVIWVSVTGMVQVFNSFDIDITIHTITSEAEDSE